MNDGERITRAREVLVEGENDRARQTRRSSESDTNGLFVFQDPSTFGFEFRRVVNAYSFYAFRNADRPTDRPDVAGGI